MPPSRRTTDAMQRGGTDGVPAQAGGVVGESDFDLGGVRKGRQTFVKGAADIEARHQQAQNGVLRGGAYVNRSTLKSSFLMAVQLRPDRAILPIVRSSPSRPVIEVLGTGFFVGNGPSLHLITAKHVIANNPLNGDERYGIIFRGNTTISVIAISQIEASVNYDLAACLVSKSEFAEALPLAIGKVDPTLNADILSYEYSSTRIERSTTGHTHVSVEPYAHKGHIVRTFDSSFPEAVNTKCLLVSFPALQGASGAPLVSNTSRKGFAVVGMIVANVERHLLPAQVVQIQEGDKYRETTSYFLPYGKALARSVIARCLEEMHIPFSYAEDG